MFSRSPNLKPVLLCSYVTQQMSIKRLTPDGHLHLIEWVLGHIIRVQLVHLPHDQIHIRLLRLCEQQELGTADSLKRSQAEE
jgi:hypothetical protein